ncbi:hypothetical protein JD488_19445 [Aeromonas jandaei]|uniref:hypothetical protein n=1 Tax=Aeromonas jandaei TaxID=650 RepID=UPI00191D16F3|nr:hypothetical protein [Aeromonas jandaei]MBL0668845.1 hypothetical protein [Aeromonas jandaei]
MSNQKFSASQREALWLAHEKKCAYTRERLDISCFHIDHIIPEYLANDPAEFQRVRNILGLNENFDLHGYENLLPCRAGANLQKGSLVFDEAHAHFFLAIAKNKKKEVQITLEKIEKRKNSGKALILLQQCLERGELSPSEIVKILEEHNEQPQDIFHLLEKMHFSGYEEISTISKSDIDYLRNRPIRLGLNTNIDGVTLTNDSNDKIHVRTCKEYDKAIQSGYYALTTFDIKMSTFFEHQCGLLNSLQAAKTPERSFITDPRVGIIDLHLMPFTLFPSLGDIPENISDATYQSKVDDGLIVIKRIKQNTLCIEEPSGMGQQLIEVARADFNNDGIEDILIFEYCYATHGTLGFGGIKILTRKSSDSLFEIVS